MTTQRVKIISWNVNGLQGILKKDVQGIKSTCSLKGASTLETMIATEAPDILCLQEIRCSAAFKWEPYPYTYAYHAEDKKGYSGTLIASKIAPISGSLGIAGITEKEGRVITLEFTDFILVNVYTPNSGNLGPNGAGARMDYRTKVWDPTFRKHIQTLQAFKKGIIVVGDLNVIPTDMDTALTFPVAGQHPAERLGFKTLLEECKLVDAFRALHPTERKYSWFTNKKYGAGCRFDFTLIPATWVSVIKTADIFPTVGSDHTPAVLVIEYTK